jgi:hypothetical protein
MAGCRLYLAPQNCGARSSVGLATGGAWVW